MSQQPWDASNGTNPDTCLHYMYSTLASLDVCGSCGSTLSTDFKVEFVWDWDGDYRYWVRKSARESKKLLGGDKRHPLLGLRDSRQFKIFRTEYPAIFRFDGKLFSEEFDNDGDLQFTEVTAEWVEQELRARVGSGVRTYDDNGRGI
jgi:hypothetical protein